MLCKPRSSLAKQFATMAPTSTFRVVAAAALLLAITSPATAATANGWYTLVSGGGCASSIKIDPLHSGMEKDGATCTSGGRNEQESWAQVYSKLMAQAQMSPTATSADKMDVANSITAIFARGQDSTPLVCGGASTGSRDVYTWIDSPGDPFLAGKVPSAVSGPEGTIFMQIYSPPAGYNALAVEPQNTFFVLPSGGCWYKKGRFSAAPAPAPAPAPALSVGTTVPAKSSTGAEKTTTVDTSTPGGTTTTDEVPTIEGTEVLDDGDDEYSDAEASAEASAEATTEDTIEDFAGPTVDPEDDEGNCFPSDATVELENGSVIKMAELSIGDSVKVGVNQFSKVFMFTHKTFEGMRKFVTVETASGVSLSLTSGHYLYVDGKLVAASTVKAGSTVTLGNGSSDKIVRVGVKTAAGLFNPQTENGNIVVNGIVSSTYTTAVEPAFAHAILAPLRLMNALGFQFTALESGGGVLSNVAPRGQTVF